MVSNVKWNTSLALRVNRDRENTSKIQYKVALYYSNRGKKHRGTVRLNYPYNFEWTALQLWLVN